MDQISSNIKIFACVPFIRTFPVLVRTDQKIDIIREAFPNLSQQCNLIYWFNGSQLSPQLTFTEAGITNKSSIVISFQTDIVGFNRFFFNASKYANEKNVKNRIILGLYPNNDDKSRPNSKKSFKNQNFEKEEKRYFFIQSLKKRFHEYNFSRDKDPETIVDHNLESFDISPMPVIY